MVHRKGDNNATTFSSISDNIYLPSTPDAPHTSMHLPLHSSLPDGQTVTVQRVTDHQATDVYVMICEASANGDGYGVDEFPTEKDFLKEVHNSCGKIFRVCDSDSGTAIAAFVILDSKYYRGQGTVADSYIVVKRELRRKGIGEFCMKTVLEFARRLGYSGIYNDTFNDNIPMRKLIEQSGFQKVGFLPMSARMPDGSVKPSVIYYRELGALSHQSQVEARPKPNLQENDACAESDTLPS